MIAALQEIALLTIFRGYQILQAWPETCPS